MKVGNFILILFFIMYFSLCPEMCFGSVEPDMEWSKTFGGTNIDYGKSIVQTDDGGYILTGYTLSFGAGDYDLWLIKTDSDGNEMWNKTFGGTNSDVGESIIVTDDGGYIIAGRTGSSGTGNQEFWLIKTDSDGNEEWNKTIGGINNDYCHSVVQTGEGGYMLTGFTWSFGNGGEAWLIKTDANGDEEWNKTFGGAGYDSSESVAQTSDGGYIMTGLTESFGGGDRKVWLIKTDSDGNEMWNKTFGGNESDTGYSVAVTGDGGYIVAGYTLSFGEGAYDFWLIKTDSDGNEMWNKTFGGESSDNCYSMVVTGDGGYLITGRWGTFVKDGKVIGEGGYDVGLIKTDSNGNKEWNKTIGGISNDYGYSVAQTGDGGYIITGSTGSFGAGNDDVWLIKIKPPTPPASDEPKPNPGITYLDRHIDLGNCVNFYLVLRDVNKTSGCLKITITDTNSQVVYTRECRIKCNTNWYVFYLCKDRFSPGKYQVNASCGDWSTTKTIQVR